MSEANANSRIKEVIPRKSILIIQIINLEDLSLILKLLVILMHISLITEMSSVFKPIDFS